MSLAISLQSEILKTRRTASLYLTLVAAAFGPFMTTLDMSIGEGISAEDRQNILNEMFVDKFQMTGILAFPIFIILICTLLQQTEYKNNTWKQVLTSPQTKTNVFLAKFINVQLLILVFLVANFLLMFLSAVILHFREPSLHLLSQSLDGFSILASRVNSYLSILAICAMQFWLGIRFKNFIIPIAIGLGCWFAGTLLVIPIKSAIAPYFPYSFHVYPGVPQLSSQLNGVCLASVLYAVVFLILGFLDFRKRRMIG